jgi:antitoxin YefM
LSILLEKEGDLNVCGEAIPSEKQAIARFPPFLLRSPWQIFIIWRSRCQGEELRHVLYVIAYTKENRVYEASMSDSTIISITEARQKLFGLVDQVNESHEPVTIIGKRGNVVLVSEEDWRSIQETLYLKSIPGVWESIEEGLSETIEECSDDLPW